MQLLDLLEQYPGWMLNADGRLWSVEEYIRQFQHRSPPGDRGPEVAALPSIDLGALTVVAVDSTGAEAERIGLLCPTGKHG